MKPVPVAREIKEACERNGWEYLHRESNVWRITRNGTVIDVAYTLGGSHNISTVHIITGRHDYWITFRDKHKRLRLLDLLEGTT